MGGLAIMLVVPGTGKNCARGHGVGIGVLMRGLRGEWPFIFFAFSLLMKMWNMQMEWKGK
jgi:hypothetical protein